MYGSCNACWLIMLTGVCRLQQEQARNAALQQQLAGKQKLSNQLEFGTLRQSTSLQQQCKQLKELPAVAGPHPQLAQPSAPSAASTAGRHAAHLPSLPATSLNPGQDSNPHAPLLGSDTELLPGPQPLLAAAPETSMDEWGCAAGVCLGHAGEVARHATIWQPHAAGTVHAVCTIRSPGLQSTAGKALPVRPAVSAGNRSRVELPQLQAGTAASADATSNIVQPQLTNPPLADPIPPRPAAATGGASEATSSAATFLAGIGESQMLVPAASAADCCDPKVMMVPARPPTPLSHLSGPATLTGGALTGAATCGPGQHSQSGLPAHSQHSASVQPERPATSPASTNICQHSASVQPAHSQHSDSHMAAVAMSVAALAVVGQAAPQSCCDTPEPGQGSTRELEPGPLPGTATDTTLTDAAKPAVVDVRLADSDAVNTRTVDCAVANELLDVLGFSSGGATGAAGACCCCCCCARALGTAA